MLGSKYKWKEDGTMKTKFKKISFFMLFVLSFTLLFSFGGEKANASEELPTAPDLSYETYEKLVNEGVLGEDVSYDLWVSINTESSEGAAFSSGVDEPSISTLAAYTLKTGDILISNGTSSAGLTGHAGIAISTSEILHIAGPGEYPSVVSLNTWISIYGKGKGGKVNTEVYRIASSYDASQAAKWASDNYKGKKYSYGITTTLQKLDPTYCSKIVWQAYMHGPYSTQVFNPAGMIVLPYSLPSYFKKEADINKVTTI
ncbi:hypothetical protein C7Y47_11495 [Lysinibacillus sphaericus]|uniref:Orthopoxovirus protein, PF05708 family n=2 Tax=Lysinibacillus sphaericus TaxID=1421 RepID=A0A544UI93_LYSSH|nr:hypothetical protein C7Y47_11495 [Lysinibacillus sp. SDF0037]